MFIVGLFMFFLFIVNSNDFRQFWQVYWFSALIAILYNKVYNKFYYKKGVLMYIICKYNIIGLKNPVSLGL